MGTLEVSSAAPRATTRGSGLLLKLFVLAAAFPAIFAYPLNIFSQQTPGPTMLTGDLGVRTVVTGLSQPTSMAFLGNNDFLVLEKASGQVRRVTNGAIGATVLDLAVNSASERGLLGITLHPDFPANPSVYLYWTCSAPPPPAENPFFPTQEECPDQPATGADTNNVLAVPLRGNRVDRFIWNGTTLVWDRNLVKLRVFQHDGAPIPPGQGDEAQAPAGNHDGGILRFGRDGKLYIIIGDVGRRGQLQNLPSGPTATGLGPIVPDDQFGGPFPDENHLTGSILRLNDDGSVPVDNPFFNSGGPFSMVFAYGIRNSFGMAVDPVSGFLWTQENGDDSFDELNLVTRGSNSGWIQFMGPSSRLAEFKAIETSPPPLFGLQQLRWPPTRLANSPAEAFMRLFLPRGAFYNEPEFSWKFAVAPAAIGFQNGPGIGRRYAGDLFVAASRPNLAGGYLFRFDLNESRTGISAGDPRVQDLVADNLQKFDITESEEFLVGRDFGVGTDIMTGPNGNLYVVSLSNGAVYEIFGQRFGR